MTGAAVFRNDILAVCHHKGHVRLMAATAAFMSHGVGMGLMTVLAGLDLAMKGMTGRTGQFAVNARIGKQLFTLFLMARQTGSGYVPGKIDLKWLMRVNMAVYAGGQSKMIPVLMTAAAGRDNLHVSRRVPLMTIQTELLMGHALALQGENNTFMALDAIPCTDGGTNGAALLRPGRRRL